MNKTETTLINALKQKFELDTEFAETFVTHFLKRETMVDSEEITIRLFGAQEDWVKHQNNRNAVHKYIKSLLEDEIVEKEAVKETTLKSSGK